MQSKSLYRVFFRDITQMMTKIWINIYRFLCVCTVYVCLVDLRMILTSKYEKVGRTRSQKPNETTVRTILRPNQRRIEDEGYDEWWNRGQLFDSFQTFVITPQKRLICSFLFRNFSPFCVPRIWKRRLSIVPYDDRVNFSRKFDNLVFNGD